MKNSQSRSAFLIALVFIIVVLLAIGGTYYVMTQKELSSRPSTGAVPVAQNNPSSQSNSAGNSQVAATSSSPSEDINDFLQSARTYTDAEVGFSFYYPGGWQVVRNAANQNVDGNISQGTVLASLIVGPIDGRGGVIPEISVQEVHSPSTYITDTFGTSDYPTYFYNFTIHQWMTVKNTANNGKTTLAADISNNTAGGLHMLGEAGNQYNYATIIPLSAYDFVVVTKIGHYDPVPLVKTILALDPDVATPVSTDERNQIVANEIASYEKDLPDVTWKTYNDAQTGILFKYPADFGYDMDAGLSGTPQVTVSTGANIDGNGCYIEMSGVHGYHGGTMTTLNGRQFCLTEGGDAAAGSSYSTYDYTTNHNSQYVTLGYTVRTSNGCGAVIGYPTYASCSYYQANVDPLVLEPIRESVTSLTFAR